MNRISFVLIIALNLLAGGILLADYAVPWFSVMDLPNSIELLVAVFHLIMATYAIIHKKTIRLLLAEQDWRLLAFFLPLILVVFEGSFLASIHDVAFCPLPKRDTMVTVETISLLVHFVSFSLALGIVSMEVDNKEKKEVLRISGIPEKYLRQTGGKLSDRRVTLAPGFDYVYAGKPANAEFIEHVIPTWDDFMSSIEFEISNAGTELPFAMDSDDIRYLFRGYSAGENRKIELGCDGNGEPIAVIYVDGERQVHQQSWEDGVYRFINLIHQKSFG